MEQLTNKINVLQDEVNIIKTRLEQLTKMMAETNVLLRRNLGIFEVTQTLFPLDSEDKIKKLESDLASDKRSEVVGVIKKILTGSIKNVSRILNKDIIMAYNYDGTKNKRCLKNFGNLLNVLYEATKQDGTIYEDFVKDLRVAFRRIKNSANKENARLEKNNIIKLL